MKPSVEVVSVGAAVVFVARVAVAVKGFCATAGSGN